jgi:hypothetical protein
MTNELTAEEVAKKKFSNLIGFTEDHEKIVQSLRFRDQDHSFKCGALLGFCGLLIASTLVQLSAGEGTAIHLSIDAGHLYLLACWGLISLFLAAGLALWSMSVGRSSYSSDPWAALLQLSDLIDLRSRIEIGALTLCAIGTACSLATLVGTLFHWSS